MNEDAREAIKQWIRRNPDDAAAGGGVALVAAGLAGWSWSAAAIWCGACLIGLAWMLSRGGTSRGE